MRSTASLDSPIRRRTRRAAPALLLGLSLAIATPAAGAPQPAAADARVITTWNAIAALTIPPNPAAFLNYAFVHLAMYNAVVGITGEYEQYRWESPAPHNASPEAAAAAAAHRILVTYFPAATATLDGHVVASLALVPDGGPQDKGIGYGVRAADHIIALRVSDGRGATVTPPPATEPGDYSALNSGFATPWLGLVEPLALESLTQFDPGPPPGIGTQRYEDELEEVRIRGDAEAPASVRSDADEDTAKYFAALPFRPMEEGLRGVAMDQAMDISDSARLFAATNTSIADAIGTAWNAKLKYMWWRPISAIGAPWQPFISTPPYPEWPSGLCSVIGAMTASLQHLTGGVDLTMGTTAVGYRTWTDKDLLDGTAVEARIWSGIHFRTSDEVAIDIGTSSATYILERYFGSTD